MGWAVRVSLGIIYPILRTAFSNDTIVLTQMLGARGFPYERNLAEGAVVDLVFCHLDCGIQWAEMGIGGLHFSVPNDVFYIPNPHETFAG
jgi:hypothetical protein